MSQLLGALSSSSSKKHRKTVQKTTRFATNNESHASRFVTNNDRKLKSLYPSSSDSSSGGSSINWEEVDYSKVDWSIGVEGKPKKSENRPTKMKRSKDLYSLDQSVSNKYPCLKSPVVRLRPLYEDSSSDESNTEQYTKAHITQDFNCLHQSTPHPSKHKSVYPSSSDSLSYASSIKHKSFDSVTSSVMSKPKAKSAIEIHQNDQFDKGPLLTYYCHPCNEQHFFHKGDVIVSDGSHDYYSNQSEEKPGIGRYMETSALGFGMSTTPTSFCSPITKFSIKEDVCCADNLCTRPKVLTARVLCYDCGDDFHHELCGEVVNVFDTRTFQDVERNVCAKCYKICCVGRELCQHPGDQDDMVECCKCQRQFHCGVCGYGKICIKNEKQAIEYICIDCVGGGGGLRDIANAKYKEWKCKMTKNNKENNNQKRSCNWLSEALEDKLRSNRKKRWLQRASTKIIHVPINKY